MELFNLNRRKRKGRRDGAVLSEQKAGEMELFYLNRRQERWSCLI